MMGVRPNKAPLQISFASLQLRLKKSRRYYYDHIVSKYTNKISWEYIPLYFYLCGVVSKLDLWAFLCHAQQPVDIVLLTHWEMW